MIALVEGSDRPVDIILVHSLSRLFRNALDLRQYRERLRRRKVRIVSITQQFGDDPAADLAVSMLAIFDEYHSTGDGCGAGMGAAGHVRAIFLLCLRGAGEARAGHLPRSTRADEGSRHHRRGCGRWASDPPGTAAVLLQTWLDRSATAVAECAAELRRLRAHLTQLEGGSARVIKLVRNKICSPDDPQIASELADIRAQRVSTEADIAVLERQLEADDRRITPAIITKFDDLLARKLSSPDAKVRREYVHLLINRAKVGRREIRISGRNSALEQALIASQSSGAVVPKAERKWRTRQDSNL